MTWNGLSPVPLSFCSHVYHIFSTFNVCLECYFISEPFPFCAMTKFFGSNLYMEYVATISNKLFWELHVDIVGTNTVQHRCQRTQAGENQPVKRTEYEWQELQSKFSLYRHSLYWAADSSDNFLHSHLEKRMLMVFCHKSFKMLNIWQLAMEKWYWQHLFIIQTLKPWGAGSHGCYTWIREDFLWESDFAGNKEPLSPHRSKWLASLNNFVGL